MAVGLSLSSKDRCRSKQAGSPGHCFASQFEKAGVGYSADVQGFSPSVGVQLNFALGQ